MAIRLLLVDDHYIIIEGIKEMLAKNPEIEVVGEADNGRTAIELANQLMPNVIIMDISMPEMNGIEATKQILKNNNSIKIIALSMHKNRQYVYNALDAGAKGYLLKESMFSDVVNAIKSVYKDEAYLSPKIAKLVLDKKADEKGPIEILTDREREVMTLLAEGKSSKLIGTRLNIATRTVDNHRGQIMNKLKLHNVVELTRYALRHGLTNLDEDEE